MTTPSKRIWIAVFRRPIPKEYREDPDTVTVYFYFNGLDTLLKDAREALRKMLGDDAVKDNPSPLLMEDWELYGLRHRPKCC